MSCPLSLSSHRRHLEPTTTTRPSFTSTAINMVLASLHRHCGQAAHWRWGSGALALDRDSGSSA